MTTSTGPTGRARMTGAVRSAGDGDPDLTRAPDVTRATITLCPDGPLLVRGDVELTAADGSVLPRRRKTVALCRCGGSSLLPLCDGTHKATGFRAP